MSINVVSKGRLREFWLLHPPAEGPLAAWHSVVIHSSWSCFADIRQTYNSADVVGELVVFNVNSFRIVASVFYPGRHLYIRHVFTHTEYDKWTKANR